MQALTIDQEGSHPVARAGVTRVVIAFIGVVTAGILYRAHQSRGFYWLDDYAHLQISRQALHHPSAILDVWGRPLMTLVYMPAAQWGDVAARATTLAMFAATAVLCGLVARRHRLPLPAAAGLFLLVQPLAAHISFSAMTQTVFSLVLAAALWLRAGKHPEVAALVASLLPLARLEGLFVLGVWAVVLIVERRYRPIPLLAVGMAGWATIGAVAHRDVFWLWHANPYGILGSVYPRAGWTYVFHAMPRAFGPVAGGLAIAALVRRRLGDPVVGALAVGLPLFYVFAWGAPAFQSGPDPVYLVSASVPIALVAHACFVSLLEPDRSVRPSHPVGWLALAAAAGVALAIVAIEHGRTSILLLLVVAGALVWRPGSSHAVRRAMRSLTPAATVGVLALAAVVGVLLTKPLPLENTPLLSKQLAAELGTESKAVAMWQDPAFGWYAHRPSNSPDSSLGRVPVGDLVELDSRKGDIKDAARLVSEGFRPVWESQRGDNKMEVYVRVSEVACTCPVTPRTAFPH